MDMTLHSVKFYTNEPEVSTQNKVKATAKKSESVFELSDTLSTQKYIF